MTYINVVSVKLFTRISGWLSFGKLLACLLIIGGGLYKLVTGDNDNLKAGFKGTTVNPGSIVLAFYNGLWAYDGWACITTITEEIKKPEKYYLPFCLYHLLFTLLHLQKHSKSNYNCCAISNGFECAHESCIYDSIVTR